MPNITKPVTTITIKKTTHARLDSIGLRGETYDAILIRLIQFYEDYNE
jgi:hypothetical protein